MGDEREGDGKREMTNRVRLLGEGEKVLPIERESLVLVRVL